MLRARTGTDDQAATLAPRSIPVGGQGPVGFANLTAMAGTRPDPRTHRAYLIVRIASGIRGYARHVRPVIKAASRTPAAARLAAGRSAPARSAAGRSVAGRSVARRVPLPRTPGLSLRQPAGSA